jgi:polyisoprenoid-binding protein YceI
MVKRKRWLIAIPAAVLALAVIGTGGYVLVSFLGHKAPAAFSLNSPAPSASLGALNGQWKIAAGSEAGYRVREKLINQPAPTEAVARTAALTGSLVIESPGGQFSVRQVSLSADLTKLHSVDTYATYQAFQRDNFVAGLYLQTGQFPSATFKADSIIPPTGVSSSTTPVSMVGHGRLTLHGVSHDVDVPLTIQLAAGRIELVGSIGLEMPDYGIQVPQIGFTRAEPHAIIEFHLFLSRG